MVKTLKDISFETFRKEIL